MMSLSATCLRLNDALSACDPHSEQIWEKADPQAGENILMGPYSTGWRERSQMFRITATGHVIIGLI